MPDIVSNLGIRNLDGTYDTREIAVNYDNVKNLSAIMPLPKDSDKEKFLKGNGTWSKVGKGVNYGICHSESSTTNKVAVTADGDYILEEGSSINIKFDYANTALNPTLNIDNTGDIDIKAYDTIIPSSWWEDGDIVNFIYNGVNFIMQPSEGQINKQITEINEQINEQINSLDTSDPVADGVSSTFIANASQEDGKNTFTKKTVGISTAKTGSGTTITNTITANTTLDNSIGTLLNNDHALNADLSNEVTARTNADSSIRTELSDEATTRANADSSIRTDLSNEVTARTNADNSIRTELSNKKIITVELVIPDITVSANSGWGAWITVKPDIPSGYKIVALKDWLFYANDTYTAFCNGVILEGINLQDDGVNYLKIRNVTGSNITIKRAAIRMIATNLATS